MRTWSRVSPSAYHRLELRAHALLAGVPLHDVWQVALPGVDRRCTMEEIRALFRSMIEGQRLSPPARALFALRRALGRVLGWDAAPPDPATWSYIFRLDALDRERSLVEPGTLDGPFRVLYVLPMEAVNEIRNATVHAFLVWALKAEPGGHRLYWAIHVLPVSGWTRPYMMLIDPFRRWIVYPALLRRINGAWTRGHG